MAAYTHTITLICESQEEYDVKLARINAYDAAPGPNLINRINDEANLTLKFTIPSQTITV